ncbi:MAG: hypothetical protein AAFY60_18095 [Myxococcota bacterium]
MFSWNRAAGAVPGQVTEFLLGPSGYTRQDDLESLTIRAVAGASAGAVDGVEVLLWTSGAWSVVGVSPSGASSVSPVTLSVDPALLPGARPGPESTVAIGFRPVGPVLLEQARVTVDHVEIDATLLLSSD